MNEDLASATHIYCRSCKGIKPMIIDPLCGRDMTGQFVGIDLVCGNCRLIIATVSRPVETTTKQAAE